MYLENYGTLCGYLARDCEVKTKNDGSKDYLTFTVCWSYGYKDEKPNFFDIVYFGNDIPYIYQYLQKGRLVRIHYSLNQDKWNDENGKPKSRISIIAEKVEIILTYKTENKKSGDYGQEGI